MSHHHHPTPRLLNNHRHEIENNESLSWIHELSQSQHLFYCFKLVFSQNCGSNDELTVNNCIAIGQFWLCVSEQFLKWPEKWSLCPNYKWKKCTNCGRLLGLGRLRHLCHCLCQWVVEKIPIRTLYHQILFCSLQVQQVWSLKLKSLQIRSGPCYLHNMLAWIWQSAE